MEPIRKIKIAYVIGGLTIGGTEQQLLALLKNFDRQCYDPSIICLSEQEPFLLEKFHSLNIKVHLLSREQSGRLPALWNLYRLLRKLTPDIVHAFSFASRAGIPTAKLAGHSKIVVSFRTDPKRWVNFFDCLLINSVDLILDNSEAAIHSYQSINQFRKIPPYEVIHNGIDLSLFDRAIPNRGELSFQNSSPTDPPIICVVAGLRPAKYLSLVLEAYALLRLGFPNVRLWFVGDGDERNKLEKLASDLNISSSVVFWGFRTDIPAILEKSFMGVLSSKNEGLPNAILEYMAARLPVVATDVGGNSEVVLHGKTGLLVPFGDREALAKALLYFLQNPSIARRFGEAGRRRVQEDFTVQQMTHKTNLIYQRLLTSGLC
jgi:glycosyltransferase involved in cell wall biosynthesis